MRVRVEGMEKEKEKEKGWSLPLVVEEDDI